MKTVLFDENGNVSNYATLMNGIKFVRKPTDNDGVIDSEKVGYIRFIWERETHVYVCESDALTVVENHQHAGCFWGEFRLKETLHYNPSSFHRPNGWLGYTFHRTSNSKKIKKRSVMGYISEPFNYIETALKQGE
jgi:hypothetical protein